MKPKNMLQTLNVNPTEVGKIKIGGKAEQKSDKKFRMPVKFDGMIITSNERNESGDFIWDSEAMEKLGGLRDGQFAVLRKIPIELPYDEIETFWTSRRSYYTGKTCECSGDGVDAIDRQGNHLSCADCKRSNPAYTGKDKCKANGRLGVIVKDLNGGDITPGGKVHVFRTTGWNSVTAIQSSLRYIYTHTKGFVTGIQFNLVYSMKDVIDAHGAPKKVQVLSIEFDGSRKELWAAAEQNAKDSATYMVNMNKLQGFQSRLQHSLDVMTTDELPEYYPEQFDSLEDNSIKESSTPQIEQKAVPTIASIADEVKSSPETKEAKSSSKTEEVESTPKVEETKTVPTYDELKGELKGRGFTDEELKGKRETTLKNWCDSGKRPEVEEIEDIPEMEIEPESENVDFSTMDLGK